MQDLAIPSEKILLIAAVVVTYNRKEMLCDCLRSLLSQSIPLQRIFVVDNASTDGTPEFMHKNGFDVSSPIEYVRKPSNTGGAGGFHDGVKRAFSAGYDLIWLMDDDGCPDTECLRLLVAHSNTFDVVGPLIVSKEDAGLAAFPYFLDGKPCSQIDKLKKYDFISYVHPFNGILIKRKVVETIGFPDPRFFIWGDEEDYRFRWKKAGFTEATVVSARFRHPSGHGSERETQRIVLRGVMAIYTVPDRRRKYLCYRNRFHNLLRYHGGLVKRTIKAVLSIIIIMMYESDRKVAIFGLYDGIIGNFSRPTKYFDKEN
jgi:rhamnopyranosyl-N-acetylglucosaminyl-diphospho-decaprenol beta-1,3/1,4-galactofuranosyltransferase